MFKIFISKESLTDLFVNHAADRTEWLKVIQNQRKLFLMNEQIDIETDLANPNSMLFMYLTATGKTSDFFNPAPLSLSEIQSDHSKVLDNPCGCYLLDIDNIETESIQKDYGVICQSTRSYQECPLTIEEFSIYPEKDESGCSWNRFKNVCSNFPSNSLIINDRNLFKNSSHENLYGLENIENILNVLLPDNLNNNMWYHVGIIIGAEGSVPLIHMSSTYEKIVSELGRIKSRLNRSYKILISLLVVNHGDNEIWEKTHNRRIISNYYFITADHKIAAFCNGKSTITQAISLKPIFCKGLENGGDAPEKDHRNHLEGYRYIINHWNSETFKLASGLNPDAEIDKIQHRLLR